MKALVAMRRAAIVAAILAAAALAGILLAGWLSSEASPALGSERPRTRTAPAVPPDPDVAHAAFPGTVHGTSTYLAKGIGRRAGTLCFVTTGAAGASSECALPATIASTG